MEISALLDMVRPLYAAESFQGCTDGDIQILKDVFGTLPPVLENYYRAAGRTKAFHRVQDDWMLPEHFQKRTWLRESDHLILLNENQGCCRAGIRREDLILPDPPVYTTADDKTWTLCAPSTSEFLAAALLYESVFTFSYNPEEFYWLTKQDLALMQSRLAKLPFSLPNWMEMTVTFYSSAPDNLAALMDCGDLQVLYGAASEASYRRLMEAMDGLGEPI